MRCGRAGFPLAAAAGLVMASAAPGLAAEPQAAGGTQAIAAAGVEAALQAAGLPRAVPAARQNSDVVNDEIVVSQLDPRGLPISSKLISRVSSKPGEERTIEDPTSTVNIVYLNQRGQPTANENGDAIQVVVGGPNGTTTLTQSDIDKPMPLALHAEYKLNGEVVDPEVVVGESGTLTITYTITNTDIERETITYKDALGRTFSKKQPVFAPFVGTLTASLPAGGTVTDTQGAVVSTDKEGNTILLWNLLLFPPMGDYEQTVSFTAEVETGSVPGLILNATPVDDEQDPSLKFTTDLFKQTTKGNKQFAKGLEQLNTSTAELANGAAQLANGVAQLADGTGQMAAGVQSGLVPGTQQLAAGAGQLATGQQQLSSALGQAATGADQLTSGADQLASGLGQLADGLDSLADNYPAVVAGAEQLRAGTKQLATAVGSASDKPVPPGSPQPVPTYPLPIPTPSGTPVFPTPTPSGSRTVTPAPTPSQGTLVQGIEAATDGAAALAKQTVVLNNNLVDVFEALTTIAGDAAALSGSSAAVQQQVATLYTQLCQPAVSLTPAECAQLKTARDGSTDVSKSAQRLTTDLIAQLRALGIEDVRAFVIARATNELADGLSLIESAIKSVATALDNGNPPPPGIVQGLDQLIDALQQSNTGIQKLAEGAGQAAPGAEQLAAANGQLADGLGQAADGSQQLATGTAGLASGAAALSFGADQVGDALQQLAAGADQAADGTSKLASGADQLQQKGTAKIYRSVIKSSKQPALAAAFLGASAARAKTALPYGLPKDATGSVAYIMTMEPVQPSNSTPWQLGAFGILLAAAGGGAILKSWTGRS